MFTRLATTAAFALAAAATAQTRVLVLSSEEPTLDNLVVATLEAQGLTATLGPSYALFTSSYNLDNTDVVYLQANFNWTSGPMPTDGQQHLLSFVQGGGGLVTCEWVQYYVFFSNFTLLEPAMPVNSDGTYHTTVSTTFNLVTSDPVMTAGVSANIPLNLTSFAGTEVELVAKPGATTFFTTNSWSPEPVGLAGWDYGSGRAVSFSTVNGNAQFDSPDFARLFGNAMKWADGGAAPCYPDCNGDAALNLSDFGCFTTKFALGDPYADCNGDSTLNLSDFGCFTTKFALGCP